MKSLMKLLRSKIAVIPIALVVVGLVMVGCESTAPDQSTSSTGQSPGITTVGVPSPDITSSSATPPTVGLNGRINATVLDSFTRAPINGALVSINVGGQNISATTAGGGLVSLGNIPVTESLAAQSQPIQITITGAAGYPSPSFWATTLPRGPSDTVNSNIAVEIIIELHAANGVVTGSLLDPVDGTLLSGVTVTLTPNPLSAEISGGIFLQVEQPFAGAVTTSTANGFTFTNIASDHDYVIDISDPRGRIRNLRIGAPALFGAAFVGGLGTGVQVPPAGTVNLDAGATLGTGAGVLAGGLSANLVATAQQGRPGGDAVTPYVTAVTVGGTRVSQGQDLLASVVTALASTTSAVANINIAFNEIMDAGAGLANIQLIDLGPKGTLATSGTRVSAAVTFDSTTTPLPNRNLLIKPATTLVAGRRYVVTGLGGLRDPAGNQYGGTQAAPPLFGGVCSGNGFPQCDRAGVPDYITGGVADLNGDGGVGTIAAERGVFFFTTNNDPDIVGSTAHVLALAGAPRVTGRRNNLSRLARAAGTTAGFGSRSAVSFGVDWSGTTTVGGATVPIAPTGAVAYNVCVVPDSTSGRTEDCVVLPSTPGGVSFSLGGPPTIPFSTGTPATAFRFTLDDVQAALAALTPPRSLPLLTTEAALSGFPNTILDNNLRIQVRVTAFNRDGAEGPQSANAADATVTTIVDLGDNSSPSLNEDANFDLAEAASEDLDGDPPGTPAAAAIFADLAVRNYFAPSAIALPSGSLLAFPASVVLPATPATFAVYDVLQSAFPATSPSTTALGRVPFDNVAGARLNRTGTLRLTFNEDILPASVSLTGATAITITDGTSPINLAPTSTQLASVTSASVGDVDRDVTTGTNGNVVSVGVSDVFAINTGDNLNVSVTDEAGNTLTQTLRLLDTIRPFATSVTVADNGCSPDIVTIIASEPLNAASATDARTNYTLCSVALACPVGGGGVCTCPAGVTITGTSRAALSAGLATTSGQVVFTAPSTIVLTFPDRAVNAAGSLAGLTAAGTFTTTGTGAFGGVLDQAENLNRFLNDGTPIIPVAGLALPATTAFTVGDTIAPRLAATNPGLLASTWRVAAAPGVAGGAGGASGAGITVVVEFTEPVNLNTATNPSNYVFATLDTDAYLVTAVAPGPIACAPVVAGAVCSVTVTFTLTNAATCVAPLPAMNTCGASANDRLTVTNLMDLSGNIIAVQNALILPAAATPAPIAGTTYTVLACP